MRIREEASAMDVVLGGGAIRFVDPSQFYYGGEGGIRTFTAH
jgi:hypothetical protein